jgi:hypothetical protein
MLYKNPLGGTVFPDGLLSFPTTIRVRGTGETGKSQHEKLSQCFQTNAIEWIFTADVGIGWISLSFEKREGLDVALLVRKLRLALRVLSSNVRTATVSGGKR